MPTAMLVDQAPYVAPLMLGVVALMAVAVLAWRRRGAPGATPLLVLALLGAAWPFGYAWELVATDYPTKVLWAKVEYLGIASGPSAWLWLTIEYTGRGRWLTRRRLALLAVEPVVVLLLVWSNEYHRLVWSSIAQQDFGSLTVLNFSHGVVFWIHATYGYLLVFFGTTLLAEGFLNALRLHWRRSAALLVCRSKPWVAGAGVVLPHCTAGLLGAGHGFNGTWRPRRGIGSPWLATGRAGVALRPVGLKPAAARASAR